MKRLDNFDKSGDVYEVEYKGDDYLVLKGHPQPFRGFANEEQVLTAAVLKNLLQLKIGAIPKAINIILTYDWAYRLRLLDLCNETSPDQLFFDPRGEIKRLVAINKVRDMREVHTKIRLLGVMLRVLLLWPPFKRWFRAQLVHWRLPDEAERYWMRRRVDYKAGV